MHFLFLGKCKKKFFELIQLYLQSISIFLTLLLTLNCTLYSYNSFMNIQNINTLKGTHIKYLNLKHSNLFLV